MLVAQNQIVCSIVYTVCVHFMCECALFCAVCLCWDCSVCLHDTAVCTYSPSIVLGGSIQSLDWTGGLDWWTGPVDWTGGLD